MFKCNYCNHLFDLGEEKRYYEPTGEEWACCPICGGEYDEAVKCELCGSYENVIDAYACESCKKELKERFKNGGNILTIFYKNEIEAINNMREYGEWEE